MRIQLAAFLLLISCTAFAGGFQVNLQGAKQLGMGHCGTGLNLGPSNAFFNPGAFAFVDSNNVSFTGNLIFGQVQYLGPAPSIYTTRTQKGIGTPFGLYGAFKVKRDSRWNMGLAIYTPFGSSISYDDDWTGQFVLREMGLTTIFVQPTVGFQITDKIGVGAGYVYGIGNFTLRKGIPIQDTTGTFGEGILEGSSNGHGFNAGLYFTPDDKLSLGLSYRSGVKVAMDDGTANFTVPSEVDTLFPATSFSTSIRLPDVVSLGVGYQVTDKLLLALDVNYIGWRSYDTLAFDFADNTDKLDDINSPREYKDAFTFRLGVQYDVNEQLQIRAGGYYDMTPVQDGYMTPETPDSDKIGLTAGASYLIGSGFKIDASFLFVNGLKRVGGNDEAQFYGTWKAHASIPSIGLQFIF